MNYAEKLGSEALSENRADDFSGRDEEFLGFYEE
jgi:hypothetical protein